MQIAKVYVNELEARTIYGKKITKGLRGGRVSLEYAGGIWEGLTKNVAFTNGLETVGIYGAGLEVEIPPEVTDTAGVEIRVGVCGVDGTGIVIPTVWASLGEVLEAVPSDFEEADKELTPSVTEQLLSLIGPMDQLGTEAKDSLVAAINEVIKLAGGDIDPEVLAAAVTEYLAANPVPETDPTVPAWAKQPTKPEYTAEEVGALPDSTEIPVVPDTLPNPNALSIKQTVGGVSQTFIYNGSRSVSLGINIPTVPTNVSAFTNDAGYLTEVPEGYAKTTDIPTDDHINQLINTALGSFDGGGSGGSGGSSNWELVNTITVEDDTTGQVSITTDSDGNSFEFREIVLIVNGTFSGLYFDTTGNNTARITATQTTAVAPAIFYANEIFAMAGANNNAMLGQKYDAVNKKISQVRCTTAYWTPTYFTSGTTLTLYGRN